MNSLTRKQAQGSYSMLTNISLNMLVVLVFLAFPSLIMANTPIDIQKSQIEWLGKKVTGQHDGTLKLESGQVEIQDDDFFGVDKYPRAVFEISKAMPLKKVTAEAPNYEISGDLTIKGITHVVQFQARVDIQKQQSRARGDIIVDRTLYGIKYKSGKFFEDIGDRAIYDDFTISFDVMTQ